MLQVAVVRWPGVDEICEAIASELSVLGYRPCIFGHDTPLPANTDIVFSFGPYGSFLHIPFLYSHQAPNHLPTLVHWNTEGMPDPRIPWHLMQPIADLRSWAGRFQEFDQRRASAFARIPFIRWVNEHMMRFRYLGDYRFAHNQGWLNVLADSSAIYARFRTAHGLPTVYAPWGGIPDWHADLKRERDIDVLWMGQRATKRRSHLLDQIREQLDQHRVAMYVADDEENPFIYGAARIAMLNRAKITLNITRTWYDDNFSRFTIAAPNRSLVVSEKLLPHCTAVQAGTHYAAAPVNAVADKILYYLEHTAERKQLVENAYQLVTTTLTFGNTIRTIMQAVVQARQNSSIL